MAAEELLGEGLGEGGGILRCNDSSRKLESSIFNSVSLGEWEAARASFACLAVDPASRENAKELLKILVIESANFWSESAAIPSPHHLSWLAIDTYKTLFPEEEDQLPGYVPQLVEIRLLLYSARGLTSFSSHVASQLCQYHAVHVLRIPGATPQPVPPFPPLTLSFLHDVITVSSSTLGHALIECLTVDEPEYLSNNEALQSIYVDCVYGCLETLNQLKSAEPFETDSSYDSQYESDHTPTGGVRSLYQECQRLVATVYDLLSLMDPRPEMTKLSKKIDRVFLTLLKVKYAVSPELTAAFESSRLYSCLLGRSTPFLINRLYEVEEYIRTNKTAEGGGATKLDGNPIEKWRELFYEALYDNKHWLEGILDSGLQLVFTGKLEELGQLLSCPEHFPLRPVLLLLGWDKYPAVGSGRELLEALWPAELSMRQPLLFQGCCQLAFQVELVQWCLKKARPHLHPSPSPAPTTAVHRAGDMFKGLETHSVLYVLHHFTPLASLDAIEVIEILKLRPRMSSLTVPFTPPPQFSRGTTPMKPSSEAETSPSPSPLSTPLKSKSFSAFKDAALRPEQERDISLFRSFCAVKLVLDAIWASLQIASGLYPTLAAAEPQQREPSPADSQPYKATRAARKLDLGVAETGDPEAPIVGTLQGTEKFLSEAADKSSQHDQLYEQQVLDKLQESKMYLSLVYPLNYRLEILENLFSLLFLTSDDIKQIKMGDLDTAAAGNRKGSSSVEDAVSSGVKVLHTRSNSDVSAAISSIALIKAKHGFLVSEKVASDLLDSLQDCIFELRAARYVLYQSTESNTGPSLSPSAMKSSISTTALQQRSTKLEQYINEARWRIQLVSAKHGITAGISARSEDWLELSSSGESGSEWTDSEDEGEGRKEGESRKKPKKASAETQQQKTEMPDTPVILEPKPEPPQQTQQGQTFGIEPPSMMAPSRATLSGKISPAPNTPALSGRPSSPGAAVQRSATFTHSGTRSPKLPRRHHSLKEKSSSRPVESSSSRPVESSIPGRLRKTDDSGDADVEDKSPDQSKRRKRLRLRSFQSSLIKKRKRRLSENSRVSKGNIVCRMLASPSSLLRMCLKHSNYHRANEVLKMFGMEGQFGEAFVRFSEQYEMVSRELAQRSRSSTPKQSPSLTPGDENISHKSLTTSLSGSLSAGTSVSGLKTSSMSVSASGSHMNLQVAIMNATNSSVALESLHRLLAPSSINRMLFSGDEHMEKVAQESGTLRVLVEHVPTLVMLDLVCSTKVDGQIAKRIIELAAGRCRPALETRHLHSALTSKKPSIDRKWSQPHELNLSGPFSLLLTLSDVSGYFTFAGMTPPTHGLSHASPYSLFTSYTHHFKVNVIMNANTFNNSYNESRERLEGLLPQEGATEDDVITLISSVEDDSQRPSHAVGNIFDELVRALKLTPHSPVLASSAKERSLMKQPSSGSLAVSLEEWEGLGVGYVWQFSRYLSKLVELLCKCLGTGSSIPPESPLLLSVLQESPTHILGRLVFERGIKPQRLALLTSDLPQLQIVEVIVKCCCPLVPGPAAISERATPQAPVIVALNEGEPPGPAQVADPCAFSQKLLSKLLAILKDFLPLTLSPDDVLGPEELRAAYHNPEIKALLAKTPILASFDLATLNTPSRQMAFYSNIANFLYAHAVMAYLAADHEGEEPGKLSMLVGAGISMATMQSSRIVQAAYFSKVGYYIGQLGLISCFDLHHTILRRGLDPPSLGLDNSLKLRITPVRADPWAEHAPSSPDPRLLYVVHNGMLSSPLPVSLSPEDLNSRFRAAETQYLNATVSIDLNKKEVKVPQWLFDHLDNLVKPVWSDNGSDTSYGYLNDLALLKYIHSKLPQEKAELLSPFLEVGEPAKAGKGKKPALSIGIIKEDLSFGYNFSLKRSSVSPKTSPKLKKKKKHSKEEKEKREATVAAISEDQAPVSYTFTPETLAFVKQQSPLMAALIHLLCSPSTGRTGKTTLDEKVEGEGEGPKEEGETAVGRMQMLQSFIGRQKSTSHPQKETRPLDELSPAPQLWKQQLDEVLSHFTASDPMRQFLVTRLCHFEAILPWDTPKLATPPKKSRRSSLEYSISLRRLSALPTSSRELGDACSFVMRKLLELGKVNEAVRLLASEPVTCHLSKVAFLTDIAISSAFVNNYSEILALGQSGETAKEKMTISNPVALLSQLSSSEQAARLSLASLKNWPVDVCVDMLSYCFHHLPPTSSLLPVVTGRLERMRVYTRTMKVCESPLPQASGQVRGAPQSPWKSWSMLASDSESRPDYVLRVLLASREFELARKWAAVHSLGQDVTQQIEVDYLFVLLEGDSPNPIAAQQVLDSLSDNRLTLQVCESVLNQCEDLQTTIFILHYMLTRLPHCIHIARTHDYCNRLLGAKALLCLPGSVRHVYDSLVSEPVLLVEQLLLDMKIDWASNVIRQLRQDEHLANISTSDTPTLDHNPMIIPEEEEEARDPFTSLMMFYAAKALEFPQPVLTRGTPLPSGVPSTATTCPPSPTPFPPTPRHTSAARPIPGERQTTSTDSAPSMTPRVSFSYKRRISLTLASPPAGEGPYEPPASPPPREKWEPDGEVTKCRVCRQVYFGMFSRRHHCRRCGRVVCAGCSSRIVPVDGYERPVRTCDDCFHHMAKSGSASEVSQLPSMDLGSVYPGLSTSPLHHWKLLPNDPLFNDSIRKEFFYERTPNTALCLALVDLMSHLHVAAAYLLDCCHSVSAQLVPDPQGRVNEEVDHYFVIGLIQNLLMNAKLRFAGTGDSSGVELCDTYLSRVDLLRQLVSSRSTRIPSIQELTKPDLARRVRDRLIEDDRFGLAMEVSTKCQLDTGAVWAAWGVACLQCGDFTGARSKFRHCFQVSSQSKMGSGAQNLPLLNRIVEQIEQNPLAVTGIHTQYSEEWSSVIVGSMALSEKRTEDCDLDIHRFNECVFYIRGYGPPSSIISFFVRHNCWTDACKYILDHHCNTDVFVEHLWVPALKAGMIEMVQERLRDLDPSLSAWETYLTATCRYFTQRSLFSVLYNTQLFMKDYIRAGMTCIKFFVGFSGRSTTIADLFSRLHYLLTARRHFQMALEEKQRSLDRRGGRARGQQRQFEDSQRGAASINKSMNTSELHNHISTISLQMKVTQFLYQCAEAMATLGDPVPMAVGTGGESPSLGRHTLQQPATLFSNGHVRAEVAAQLLTGSHDIIEGFELTKEILQAYRLPPVSIFCGASRGLARRQRYGDIRLLLQCIQKSRFGSDSLNDEIIMAAIKVLANQTRESKQVDKLVQLLTSERSKIKALVSCGKLKNAYLIAIKSRLVEEVRKISEIAGKAGQLPVRDICEKWLQANAV